MKKKIRKGNKSTEIEKCLMMIMGWVCWKWGGKKVDKGREVFCGFQAHNIALSTPNMQAKIAFMHLLSNKRSEKRRRKFFLNFFLNSNNQRKYKFHC